MSVRHGMLALLQEGPKGVYQLRKEFETRTGGTWPINIGQVYSTMQRLQRDGFVVDLPADDKGVEPFELTEAGRREISGWWSTPVERGKPDRDELVIKLALAATQPGVDVQGVVQHQRNESMKALRDYTRLKAQALEGDDLAWQLVLENLIFTTEAEVRWLDHVEVALLRAVREKSHIPGAARVEGRTVEAADEARGTASAIADKGGAR